MNHRNVQPKPKVQYQEPQEPHVECVTSVFRTEHLRQARLQEQASIATWTVLYYRPHSKTFGMLLVKLVYIYTHTNFAGHGDGPPVLVDAKTLPAFCVQDKD